MLQSLKCDCMVHSINRFVKAFYGKLIRLNPINTALNTLKTAFFQKISGWGYTDSENRVRFYDGGEFGRNSGKKNEPQASVPTTHNRLLFCDLYTCTPLYGVPRREHRPPYCKNRYYSVNRNVACPSSHSFVVFICDEDE